MIAAELMPSVKVVPSAKRTCVMLLGAVTILLSVIACSFKATIVAA